MKNFYVYVYLDPRKSGNYVYSEYEFDYEPFYVGKGHNNRLNEHLTIKNKYTHFYNKLRLIQRECKCNPIIIKYKEMLSEKDAFNIETNMIKLIGREDLKTGPLCNHTNGGEGTYGRIVNDKTRKKQSMWIRTAEIKKKISESEKGKIVSAETRKKLSISLKGRKMSDEAIRKMAESHKGKKVSDEAKKKSRETQLGRKQIQTIGENNPAKRPEVREKIRLSKLGKKRGPMSEECKLKIKKGNIGKHGKKEQ